MFEKSRKGRNKNMNIAFYRSGHFYVSKIVPKPFDLGVSKDGKQIIVTQNGKYKNNYSTNTQIVDYLYSIGISLPARYKLEQKENAFIGTLQED